MGQQSRAPVEGDVRPAKLLGGKWSSSGFGFVTSTGKTLEKRSVRGMGGEVESSSWPSGRESVCLVALRRLAISFHCAGAGGKGLGNYGMNVLD